MVVCNNIEDYKILKSLRSHGWARDLSNQKKIENKFNKINKRFLFKSRLCPFSDFISSSKFIE